MEVIIDGVTYVPKNEVPELTDDRLKDCLAELTAIQYFPECSNKHRAWAWDAIKALAPDIAELSSNDAAAAYEMFHAE
jgi:hypothetical protein